MGYAERIQTMKRVFWMGGIELCREQMLLFLMESGLAGPDGELGPGRKRMLVQTTSVYSLIQEAPGPLR